MRKMTTRAMVTLALLAALQIVLARIFGLMPSSTSRFSIEAVPIMLTGYLFGPIAGALVGFVGDLVGAMISGFGYNPLLALPPILIGVCTGLMRHMVMRKPNFINILISVLPAFVLGSILWQSYWLAVLYGKHTFGYYLLSRAVQFSITSVLDTALVFILFKTHVFERLNPWQPIQKKKSESEQ